MNRYSTLDNSPQVASARRYLRNVTLCAAHLGLRYGSGLCIMFLLVALPVSACTTVANLVLAPEVNGKIDPLTNNILAYKIPSIKANQNSRIKTVAYGVDGVLGGQYAGVVLDGNFTHGGAGWGNSDTTAAGQSLNGSVTSLNSRAGRGQFVAGHLVNHEFGGNYADQNNFLIVTSKMNSAMKNYGESSAKEIMRKIYNRYYGANYNTQFVATNGSNLWYKPGIIYETEAFQELTLGNHNPTLITNSYVTLPEKQKLVWQLETRIRFVLLQYERVQVTSRVVNYIETDQYFEMTPTIYNAVIGPQATTLLGTSRLSLPGSNAITTFEEDRSEPNISPTYKWVYTNTDISD